MSLQSDLKPARVPASFRRRWVVPVAVSVVLFAVTTAVVWLLDAHLNHQHLVFLYVVPASLVAIRYGSVSATGIIVAGSVAAAYLLYPPHWSIAVASAVDLLELALFSLLALLASQVVSGFLDDREVARRRGSLFSAVLRSRWPSLAARWDRFRLL